jgi:hypothetical protein
MTNDEFKQLQVGDRVTHPAFAEILTITWIEFSYDYTNSPPTQWTNAITTHNQALCKACGERSRTIGDERDVRLLQKVPLQEESSKKITALKSPQELLQALLADETAEAAVIVYKEAAGYANLYREVQAAALACAQADMQSSGETRRRTTFGSCGWTEPKSHELDKEAWQTAVAANPELAELEQALARAEQALKEAQRPYSQPRQPAFYIR